MKQGWFSETPREYVASFGIFIAFAALFIVLRTSSTSLLTEPFDVSLCTGDHTPQPAETITCCIS